MKTCSKCKEVKPLDCFYKRQSWCKSCRSEYSKKYRIENKEALAEYDRKYRIENKEALAECYRKYYAKNKEVIAEYHKDYNAKNKEAIAKRRREYRTKNREVISAKASLRHKGFAKEDITPELIDLQTTILQIKRL